MNWFPPGPLSDEWEIPTGSGPNFLVKYLRQQQIQTYGTYFKDLKRTTLIRNFKLLLAKYHEDDIKRAIALGCTKSEHPFSTKFVEDMIKWLLDIRLCPMSKFYQNKS